MNALTRLTRNWSAFVAAGVLSLLASSPSSAQIVEYYHLDAIGSTRAVTDQAGNVIERHDYLPFGEECTTGPCAANPGLGVGQPRKFTGKERDNETGLDYFGARYYAPRLGRFLTVDPHLNVPASLVDPQRWNRYSYVANNPLSRVDPDGADQRQAIGALGEKLAEWYLKKEGYTILLSAARKAVNQGGVDLIATKGSEVLVIDNKALWSRGTASSASALTKNLQQNITAAIGELTKRLDEKAVSTAEKALIEATINALNNGSFQLVVTGAGGITGRVGTRLAAQGITFKILGKTLGVGAAVMTELYFAEDAGGFLADVPLSDEELGLYQRWRAGEDIFGNGSGSQE